MRPSRHRVRREMPRPPEATVWFREKRPPRRHPAPVDMGLPLVSPPSVSRPKMASRHAQTVVASFISDLLPSPRLLVVDAQVLLRVSRALLVGQQETSGSAVMGFAASCFHAWSLTSVELVQWLLPWRRRVSRARVCCVIAVSCLSLRCRDASRIGNQRGRHGVLSWWECLGGLGVRTARFSSNRSKFVVASGEMKTSQTFTLLGRLTWPAVGCDSRAADRDTCRVKWHYHVHFV